MANRALAAKVERAKRQIVTLAQAEHSKPFYSGNLTLGAAEARRAETARLLAEYKGKISYGKTVKPQAERVRGGWSDRSQIVPGEPRRAGIRYANVTSGSALIRRGVVVG